MEHEKSLAELTKDVSGRLLDSIRLLNILYDLVGSDPKLGTVISILQKEIRLSFEDIRVCRQKIYILD